MALTLVPTGWCCTKSRNGISSFTTSPVGVGTGDASSACRHGAASPGQGAASSAPASGRPPLCSSGDPTRAWRSTRSVAAVGNRVAAGRGLRRPDRLAADRPAHGAARDPDPSDVRHGLATDEAALVEQPVVLAVELLERVVREDRRLGLLGDAQHERIATTDRTRGRGDEFVVGDRGVELLDLATARCDARTWRRPPLSRARRDDRRCTN